MSTDPACFEDPEPVEDESIGLDLIDHIRLIESVLMKAVERLYSDLLPKELGRAGALHVWLETKDLLGFARDLQQAADKLLIATLEGERKAEIDGRQVEVRRGWNRRWDHPLVAGAIAASTLEGERIPEVDEVVTAIVHALGAATQWKTGALKEMGISDEGYCQKELGRATVSVI